MESKINHHYIDAVNSHNKNYYKTFNSYYFYKPFVLERNEKSKKIKYNEKEYDFFTRKFNNKEENYILIFIGNKNKCIKGIINFTDGMKENNIYIEVFGYYDKIYKKNTYETSITECFIEFIKKKHKNINKFILTDNCIFVCNKKLNNNIGLYYFFKYGNIFYMDKYLFELDINSNDIDFFNEIRKKYLTNNNIDEQFLIFFDEEIKINKSVKNELDIFRSELVKYYSIIEFLDFYTFTNNEIFNIFLNILLLYFGNYRKNYLLENNKFIMNIYE